MSIRRDFDNTKSNRIFNIRYKNLRLQNTLYFTALPSGYSVVNYLSSLIENINYKFVFVYSLIQLFGLIFLVV